MVVFSCCSQSNVAGIWMWKYLSLLLPAHVAPCHVTRNCFQTRFFHNRFWKCAFCCYPVCCCCFFQIVRTQSHPNVCAKVFSKSTGFFHRWHFFFSSFRINGKWTLCWKLSKATAYSEYASFSSVANRLYKRQVGRRQMKKIYQCLSARILTASVY